MGGMNRRRYENEEESGEDSYVDVECPQCEAPIRTKFQRGRHARRLHCPVCKNPVTLSRPPKDENAEIADLIQIQVKSKSKK